MKNSFDGLQAGLRIMLSCCMAYSASEHFLTQMGPEAPMMTPVQALLAGLLAGLLLLTALWLAFGLRTRVVALVGVALFAGKAILVPGLENVSNAAIGNMLLVCLLAAPLLLSGGGRFSLLRGGWQVQL
jgi:uncharacterized membrane protein YphA (DoxX/SURF4 family)